MSDDHRTAVQDELLDRIARLEQLNARLQKQVSDLENDLVKSIQLYNEEYLTIYDLLWPVAYKLFPGLRDANAKFDAVFDAAAGRKPPIEKKSS